MSSQPHSPEPNRSIHVLPLVAMSARRCWAARDDLLRIGIVPLILIFLITLPAHDLMEQVLRAEAGGEDAIIQAMAEVAPHLVLLGLFSGAATCLFAVNLLRLLTLGPASVPALGLTVSGRFLRFCLFLLAVSVIVSVVTAVLALVLHGFASAGILTALTLGTILWLALIVRLSPRWIGIAIDAPMSFSTAWTRTKGQGTKLVLALFLIQIAALIIEQFLGIFFQATGLIDLAPLAFGFLIGALELIRVALQLGALLAAYPQFVRETV